MRILHSIALLSILAAPAAFADNIDVHSTGLGAFGSADQNYSITVLPAGATGSTTGQAIIAQPNTLWYQPTGATQWINNTGVGASNDIGNQPTGTYTYETTFTLGANDIASTATLSIELAADDSVSILLNGIPVGSGGYYSNVTLFTISNGFQSGMNTLDFEVQNSGGGPTGLYADISGTVSTPPVPEPSSIALLGTGLFSVAGIARRKFLRA